MSAATGEGNGNMAVLRIEMQTSPHVIRAGRWGREEEPPSSLQD